MADRIPADAYVMIIGGMKCGTTSLFEYLKGNSAICPVAGKEPAFFCENQFDDFDVAKYEALWSYDSSVHKYALEASTGYSKYPVETGVPRRIAECGLEPHFIYLVRNPFDRIESQFDFTRVANPSLRILNQNLIDLSDYYLQVKQYHPYFSKGCFLILDFDELVRDPVRTLQRVYVFLGIEEPYYPKKFKARNVTRRRSSRLKYALQRRLKTLLGGDKHASGIFEEGDRLVAAEKRLLTEDERRIVHEALKDNMTRLHQEYGVDVAKWGFEV